MQLQANGKILPYPSLKTLLMMKFTALLILATCLQLQANTYAQTITLNVKNSPLEFVLAQLKKQSGYQFFYKDAALRNAKPVTLEVSNRPFEEVLNLCLKDQPLSWSIVKKTVVILEKENDRSISRTDTLPQNQATGAPQTVSGTLLENTGKPISGAAVALTTQGNTRYTNTDERGVFSFTGVARGSYTIVVTHITYNRVDRKVKITDAPVSVHLSMAPFTDEQKEVEVVMNNGYQSKSKATQTGAANVISSKEIEASPSTNMLERLEGKVPGVLFDVRNNRIQVRGTNGLTTNGLVAPLVVIDGFPAIDQNLTNIPSASVDRNPAAAKIINATGNAILSTLNPNDIESITFLKDAAAAAIWGSMAANGVIVIETKRGKRGMPQVNGNTTWSVSNPANFKNLKSMSSAEYIDLEKELFNLNMYNDPATGWKSQEVSEAVNAMFRAKSGEITAAQRDSILDVLGSRNNRGQIKDYLLQRAVTQQYNLSLSGGGDNNTYYLAGNYTRNVPVYKSNTNQNYYITSNTTNDFFKRRLTIGTNLNYTYAQSKINTAAINAMSIGTTGLRSYDMLADENGAPIQRTIDFTRRVTDSLTRLGYLPWTYNPVDELKYNNFIDTKSTVRMRLSAKGVITNWLSVEVSGQLQRSTDQQDNLQNKDSYQTRQIVNMATTYNTTTKKVVNGIPVGGIYKMASVRGEDYGLRGQFNINKSFKDHRFNAILGSEIRQNKITGTQQTLYGYDEDLGSSAIVNPGVPYSTLNGGSTALGSQDNLIYRSIRRYLSYYGMLDYGWKNKYFVSGSLRYDDANIVGVDRRNRAQPLWSAGGRWNVSSEPFMQHTYPLNRLSLRATYGVGGNAPNGGQNYTTVNIGSTDFYSQLPYTSILSPANPMLGWETTKTTDFGLDAGFFNERISLTVDVYKKKTENVLYSLPVNATYGFNLLEVNASALKGHGVEVALTAVPVKTPNWRWTTNFNLAYNTNKVTDNRFPNNTGSILSNVVYNNFPNDFVFAYAWAGLDSVGQTQLYDSTGKKLNSTAGSTTQKQMKYMGRSTPPYFGGFTNTVQYKNFTLTARITFYMGYVFRKMDITGGYPTTSGVTGLLNNSQVLAGRWRQAGDEATAKVPGLAKINFNSLDWYKYADINVLDASNIRFQQLTLGYALPQSVLNKIKVFRAISANATVSNLGIIWRANKEGLDPDYANNSNFTNLPPPVNYSFNLNFSF
jgi:TonB-dependent starch-binding outer membrane protein SusC